jgi:Xaa-Pro dipeptidase
MCKVKGAASTPAEEYLRMKEVSFAITAKEFEHRRNLLRAEIERLDVSGVVLFDSHYILYFTGFAFIPTERPIAFIMNRDGEPAMLVPRLESEHAKGATGFERIDFYVEYPDDPHPATVLAKTLQGLRMSGDLAADQDGYPWILGYRGPSLTELTEKRVERVAGFIEDQMAVKSEAELFLIRESCKWGNLAHRLLQQYTKPGITETEVSQRATNEATGAMLLALGSLYRAQNPFSRGAGAGYRGQIGRNAAIPHALANNIVFQPGDVLVTGASAAMWGYNSELERTMIIGPASTEQKRIFDHMKAAQEVAFEAMKPHARCSDVDRRVRGYYDKHDLKKYWKHHTGHAIGLRYHEGPFLDIGDNTELLPGMVFTVEPGFYASDLGGFRHSDTVLITEDGLEMLTYYPRDLESLTIPA